MSNIPIPPEEDHNIVKGFLFALVRSLLMWGAGEAWLVYYFWYEWDAE
ncbi:hypothetical protein [Alkalicoccobacillus murimartini]|uniref:Uncharacterized protein n=1 Tax=Alkalicoccobacillus murimartini TaxID=171685 RepID=A0ABT9YFG6_9BACI|nr:hypothetical protein [Alkalicoccobacillus murimartini]MDQ0205814.1 hypothetical protein [Alkalicoccobacillus murimartini]